MISEYKAVGEPVRKIRPTRRSVSGIFPFRGQKGIPFESTLERDFLIRTEFDRTVQDIIAQPVRLPFTTPAGRNYHYTPDFLVLYFSPVRRPRLVEVKPAEEWRQHWREWSAKWKAAGRHAAERGWTFRIHDESRIRDVALANIQLLRRYQGRDAGLAGRVRQISRERGVMTAQELQRCAGVSPAQLWLLLAERELEFDLNRPLGADSKVWVTHD